MKPSQQHQPDSSLPSDKPSTARKALAAAERMVREAEARYRGLFDSVQDAVLVCHHGNLLIESVNRAATQLYRQEAGQLVGRCFDELLCDTADRQRLKELLADQDSGGVRLRQCRGDGGVLPVQIQFGRLRSETAPRLVLSVRDLSGQTQIEAALKQSEKRYFQLLDRLHEVVFQTDAEGSWLFLTPAWTRITGWSINDSLGQSALQLAHEQDRPRLRRLFEDLTRGRAPVERLELRLRRSTGDFCWVAVGLQPVLNRKGQVVGGFGVLSDITERRLSQSALRGRDAILNTISFSTAHLLGETVDDDSMRTVLARVGRAARASCAYLYENETDDPDGLRARCRYVWERESGGAAIAPDETQLRYAVDGFERWQYLLAQGKAISDRVEQMPVRERERFQRRGTRSVLAVSVYADGQWWGFLGLECADDRRWSEPEIQAGHVAADALGAAVVRMETQARLQLSARVLENTREGVVITSADGRILAVNRAFCSITGYSEEEVRGRNPRLLQSGQHDSAFYRELWRAVETDGYWQGEIWNRRRNGDVYPEWLSISTVYDNRGRPSHRVGVFSDITEIKRSQTRLEHLSHHDALTGLPNRILLRLRLEHALQSAGRSGRQIGVLLLDLDRFKHINDTLGHAVGDELLKSVAQRLSRALRSQDTLARLGGDEFVLVVEDMPGTDHAAVVADKLLQQLTSPVAAGAGELFVGGSIGIALYPQDGDSVDTLLRNADTAMYRAKERGGGGYHYYSADMTESALRRLGMESSLRRALGASQLHLYYQPQIDLLSGRLLGVEALIRWQHPELGLLAPGHFLSVAEESRLIMPITRWVLEQACRQVLTWSREGLGDLKVAVNISGSLIHYGDLVASVRDALEVSGLDAARLELEITEDFVLGQGDAALTVLQQLRELGVGMAIDDFGTGYSSLSYLKHLPIQKLKIDRSFVDELPQDPDDVAIARTVIALAANLRLQVIAEGVENAGQIEFLRGEGCHQFQGFYFARPMPAEDFADWQRERLT